MKFKTILAIAVIASGAFGARALTLPELPDKEGFGVKGYVHDGTAGVGGVLVSDGYSFATTAADGSYYLAPHKDAYCVFVIIPSGYEIATVENGIAKHFVTLGAAAPTGSGAVTGSDGAGAAGSDGAERADFALNPIGDDTNFTFLAHADTQPEVYVSATCWNGMNSSYTDMKKTGQEIAARDGFKPFNLHMGDIVLNTNTFVADYSRYVNNLIATGYDIPLFATPGNHDRRYKTDYMEATATYRATWGPLWYSFNRGRVHFISVDDVLVAYDGDYTRGIDPAAIAWIREDLSHVEPGSTVVCYTHIPLTRNNTAKNVYKELLEMLNNYNTLVISGHLHRTFNNFTKYYPNVRERNMSQLGGGSWRGPCCLDGTPSGYCIYRVEGDEISWKYKWTGRDPDRYMFRMYEPGQFGIPTYRPADDKTIMVNVWDYDERWSVTWSLDGQDMGELPRYEGMKDPWAVYNYDGLDEYKDGEAVSETYHIFHADVPASGSKVEVTVKDPFGRVSTSSLQLQSGIETVSAATSGIIKTEIYNLGGVRVMSVEGYPYVETLGLEPGCYIYRMTSSDGTILTEKQHVGS